MPKKARRSTPRSNTRPAKGYLVDTPDGPRFIERVIVPARDRRDLGLARVFFEVLNGDDVHLTLHQAVADARSRHHRREHP